MSKILGLLLAVFLLLPMSSSEGARVVVAPTEQLPQVILREQLIQQATIGIEDYLQTGGETRRHTIEEINTPAGLRLPQGRITYRTTLPNGVRLGKGTQVNVDVLLNGSKYATMRCLMRVRAFDQMVTANKQLIQGTEITAQDLRIDEREYKGENWTYFTDIKQVIGKVARRGIGQGEIITSRNIQNPVIIHSGDLIDLSAVVNGIRVTTQGKALENGREGEYINVKNLSSNKVVRGKVIDKNNVEISR
ncbi:flagellar basal body P-ring formation chaperone FlgA [Anaerovibrio sp. RM50]|uniref:flagellar basal body P-ring formation chaperone FlgA n=1 Tax=Anaerovibrio sp. RM50 TaxID=1200557 RepID=UPI000483BCF5|nr:flagellar basal body P-ring formation chaperone FlgA [Anaerovibrio sp. RM50]